MPDNPELNKTPELTRPEKVSDAFSRKSSLEQVRIDKYDDTTEVDKILETVLSAQSEKEQGPDLSTQEESAPIPPGQVKKKTAKATKVTSGAVNDNLSSYTQTSRKPPPAPPQPTTLDKEETAMLKAALIQKNQLLSTGFARLNNYLKHIRSQLDQLQSHIDKLSQESLKDIRSPLPDKISWPKYSTPVAEDGQWKPLVDEIEKLYKKLSPSPISLKVEDNWPIRPLKGKTGEAGEWDKTFIPRRRSEKQDENEEKKTPTIDSQYPVSREQTENIAEDRFPGSFEKVRESLRRIKGLVEISTIEKYPILEPSESGGQVWAEQTEPDTESTLNQGERLTFRQYAKDLKHSDRVIRVRAAAALAKSRLKSTPEILIDAWCNETVPEVRNAIVKAMVELDYKDAIPFFIDALDEDNVKIQIAALEGLHKFETSQITAGLLKALRSRFYHVRRRAVTYLGWNKVEVAFPQLLKMLKDENEFVRKATISTLFALQKKEAIPPLIEVLHDSSPGIRKKTVEVLYRWTGLRNDFLPNAPGAKRLVGIDHWKEWWKKNGQTFRISRIYRVEKPANGSKQVTDKEKTISPSSSAKGNEKKISKPSAIVKPSRKRLSISMEQEHLVLAADIFPGHMIEPISPKDRKKKTRPRSITEKNLEVAISKESDGITLQELGDKLGVKWQTLTTMTKKLVKTQRLQKVDNKYFARKKSQAE